MRLSLQTLRLLQVFMEDPSEPRYGLQLMDRTGLKSGTIYPALHRLESEGWLRSWSEPVDSSEVGRPARRLYALTPTGLAAAEGALAPFREVAAPRPQGTPGAEVGVSSAIEILGAVVLVAGALALLALLRGIHNAAVPRRLVERALEQLPPELRDRYGEEWRADLADPVRNAGRRDPAGRSAFAAPPSRWQGRRAHGAIAHVAGDPASWPQLALDAPALGLAYFSAYALRFGGDVPSVPHAVRTHASVRDRRRSDVSGARRCLRARHVEETGQGARGRRPRHPRARRLHRVHSARADLREHGFVALNVPAGVYVIFALSACALMALSRAAITLTRVART